MEGQRFSFVGSWQGRCNYPSEWRFLTPLDSTLTGLASPLFMHPLSFVCIRLLRQSGRKHETMTSADHPNRIHYELLTSDVYPCEVVSEIADDFYTLHTPLGRGHAKIVSDGHVLLDGDVQPGMVRLASPGERVTVLPNSPSRRITLTIPGVEMRQLLDRLEYRHHHGRRSYVDPLMRPNYQVERIAIALLAAPEFDHKQRQLYVDGLAYSLLACLLDGQTRGSDVRDRSSGRALSDLEFDRCCQYADAMMEEGLHLDAWAGVVGMATTEFARRFREKTQQAPYTWFMNRRIDRAKQMLKDRKRSLVETAFSVGFCSQSHFSEAFRRRVGCSPARWRAGILAQDLDSLPIMKDGSSVSF